MDEDNFQAATEAFLSWLEEIGVRINPKMVVKDLRSKGLGRGVVAAASFEEDEIIFSIPRNLVLNMNTIFASDNANSGREALASMPPWLALTAALLSEAQQPNSKWAPYLAVLPKNLDSLVFWSDTELAQLQASTVVGKIGRAGAEEMFSKYLVPLGLGEYNSDMYHRVASIIMAYAFDIPEESTSKQDTGVAEGEADDLVSDDGEDEKTILSMIPLADLLNADADRNNARLCCDNEDLEMRTIKPISEGQEILNDYGQLPRSDLLRRYGYVTEDYSSYDVAEISTSLVTSVLGAERLSLPNGSHLDPLSHGDLEKRINLADREGVLDETYDLVHSGQDGPAVSDELIALMYLLLLDEDNLEAIITAKTSLPSRSKIATELVGQVLAVLIQRREHEYATTMEEDEKLMLAGNLPKRTEMAIQVRRGEKKVLRGAVNEAFSFSGANKRMRIGQESPRNDSKGANGRKQTDDTCHPTKKRRFN
ncbi:hypothetical protein HYALB_00006344 [Hymenoscyphus albidus]|uniref:SET domain-containing protein n=1 Tax=Hymenoscyphus albidus TaxID=595503 RepID=A0A9N9Q3H5_9HELO|nr:hypothetical protein HYALB_00006344 [Hymenoscyphus albidus]